ncbi:MAG: chromosome segregation protein SMC [Desulfobacterales bacterium]|nr:chromosome segregation protein SMC [Desulfobacterales bacterium]
MKILELRFKNLNSLYGEWMIDFTDPEYISNGIFALTGPTGAGKSTILDAICLALYGATPRLGRITKSGNEIMSRQTGECYAEVVFESQAGRFLCHWEQRRARKKADGNLQDQEHQIADADTGKPIETKKSRVAGVIEDKTGMDFDRFTRSILLAQGGFDTFLRAGVEQKSKILEQITGTKIYSEISRRVHERRRSEREKLSLLLAETSGIIILEPEDEEKTQLALEEKQKQETELAGKSTETVNAIEWLTSIDGLKKEINGLSEEAVHLKATIETFKPERNRLKLAMKAASLDGVYATLTAVRKEQSDDRAALKAEERALPKLESSADQQAELLRSMEKQTVKARDALKTAGSLIRKVRSLDQKLAAQEMAVSEGKKSCKKDEKKIENDKKARLKRQGEKNEAETALGIARGYLKAHARDEWLISGLAGIDEQLTRLHSKQKEAIQKEADLKSADTVLLQAKKNLEMITRQCNTHRKEVDEAIKRFEQGKEALSELLGGRLLREYRTEKDTLYREMAFLSKIAELEDHRARLEDDKPCPLCGSREHPFAEGNVPIPDETDKRIALLSKRINDAEKLEVLNKECEERVTGARKKLNDSEKREVTRANDKKNAETTLADLTDSLEALRADLIQQRHGLVDKLQPLGIKEIPDDGSSLLEFLKTRLNAWQAAIKKKAEIEKRITDIDSEIMRLDGIIETQNTSLMEKQDHLKNLTKEYAAGQDERKTLYGGKDPDQEEGILNKAVADAESAERKAGKLNTELQQKLTAAKTHVESLKSRIGQRRPDLKRAESDFSSALESAGFSDEKQFLEAGLKHEELEGLSSRAKELDRAQTELTTRQKDREARLAAERAKKVTDKTIEELEPQFKAYEESLKALRDAVAGLKHKLRENAVAKDRIKEKQTAIEARKKECRRWEALHGLIGSADGKKYRNFAQGLTFELVVSHANRQLEKMTDRYLLIRDDDEPLALNVVDNYQAGEIRSTKNLSGGESFIVSLTLALGLSRMASRKVRVDSLFLDEGFGTLDEEALDTALESLSGLRQDGKLIGIISHISALKERIRTQINIRPKSGGKSTVAGPGCAKIQAAPKS